MKGFKIKSFLVLISLFVILFSNVKAQTVTELGGFETDMPSYWTKGTEPSGTKLEWATDQSRNLGRSLKITKSSTTSDVASWVSENMVDFWSQRHYANVDMKIGAYVKTLGVNTNPANDDAKWYISYTFYDSTGTLIGETKLPINQTTANSTGWIADTNAVGQTILPKDSWKTIIKFVAGKNATGTVWADDFMLIGRNGGWAGQDWNTSVGVPTGWTYWLPPNGGNDGIINSGFENTVITSEEAHTGLKSLKFDLPITRATHDGYIGTKRMLLKDYANPGDKIRISVWVKAKNLVPDSAAAYPTTWAVGFTYGFFKSNGNNDGFNNLDGYPKDMQFVFPKVTSFDWTKYYIDVQVPNDANAKALEVRLHAYSMFSGTVYFDDLEVTKLDMPNVADIGSFETDMPSYWTKGTEPSGAKLEWATDQSRNLGRSLKITKSSTTSDVASWVSENMVDFWSQRHYANVDMKIGAYVKTLGVNTNPANDDAKWYISYTFYDSTGTLIGETKLPINQTTANSTGWIADTNAVGQTILPKDSWKTIIKFVAGKNATGTVWADDFMLIGRNGGWAGQDWNTSVGVPTGWTYWLPPNGGNDGIINSGFENTVITSEEAHTGLKSLKFDLPITRATHDGYIGTRRMLFNNTAAKGANSLAMAGVNPGDKIRISVWVKAKNLLPDSAAAYPTTWAVGFTYGFFKSNGNNDGFNNLDGYPKDMQFVFPKVTSFDWTKYYIDVQVPNDANAKALEVRLHAYSMFSGTVYFDDLEVTKLDMPNVADIGSFETDMPSYWTKGTEPSGAKLEWATDQSRNLGRSLKITKSSTTSDVASWVSENMVDFWSQRHYANVDMKIGAYVKTLGVNTNPANDDAKWYISYTFYDSTGTLIGETKLPINQTTANSTGWIADTNAVGQTILPKDSWKTIIKFVAGKNATGTVWADDFMLIGRNGGWAGQDWNTSVGVPTGWTYWLPPNGGNDGIINSGFENTVITTEEAHTGLRSLKFNMPASRATHDGYVGTRRMLFNNTTAAKGTEALSLTDVKPGSVIRISVWVKAKNLVPDSAAAYPTTWAVGFTYGFFKSDGNNDGFNNLDGYPKDMQFVFPKVTSFDWTKYYIDVQVPNDANAKALEVRLHVYSMFSGTVYFDDLEVNSIGVTGVKEDKALPASFTLYQNYPNPFNPSTIISYSVPDYSAVNVKIYDMLGREIKSLFNGEQKPGMYNFTWNGDNNYGSKVASGTYIVRVTAGSHVATKKMLLLK